MTLVRLGTVSVEYGNTFCMQLGPQQTHRYNLLFVLPSLYSFLNYQYFIQKESGRLSRLLIAAGQKPLVNGPQMVDDVSRADRSGDVEVAKTGEASGRADLLSSCG